MSFILRSSFVPQKMAENGGFSKGKSAIFPSLEPGLLNASH